MDDNSPRDSRRGVGNDLDRGRGDVVDNDRATRTQTDNCHDHDNAKIVLGVAVERGPEKKMFNY